MRITGDLFYKKIYKNEPCPGCGNFTNRGVSIDAVVVRNRKLLLIQRGVEPYKGYWATPGGYVSWDESAEEAAKREVKEETDLDVTKLKLVGVYSSPDRHPNQVINLVYLVEANGTARKGDDAEMVKWFDLNNLPEKLAFDHRQNISDASKFL